jgi:signal transduction histidine kinase
MRERVAGVGGSVIVETRREGGTALRIDLPFTDGSR